MLNPKHTVSTIVLMAQRPGDIDPKELRDHLLQGAYAIGEMSRYEAALIDPDVNLALAGLAQYDSRDDAVPPFFPRIRAAIEAHLTHKMLKATQEREAAEAGGEVVSFPERRAVVPSRLAEEARHDRFMQDPGRYLPGAVPCLKRVLGTDVIEGFVHYEGRLVPWVFGPSGVGLTEVYDAVGFMEQHPATDLILVVGARLLTGPDLPFGVQFVAVK